jgi:putative ABC transport system permease protein
MKLVNISFGNLRRRIGKTALLVSGLTIGVAMVVAMMGITFQMQEDLEKKLDEYGANIIISPRTENLSLSYGGVNVADTSYGLETLSQHDAEIILTIENDENISAVAPKLIGSYKAGERSVLIVGVDFKNEFKIKKWWRIVGSEKNLAGYTQSPATGPHEVIIGSSVSETLNLTTGDTLTMGEVEYKIMGVLEVNTSQDDSAVFMHLAEAQTLLGKEGAISMIEVSALCSDCPIDEIVTQIGGKLPHAKVSAVRQALTLKMDTVNQMVRFSLVVSIVVLAIGSLIVFISMLSSVNERTKEIGVLRAIGYRQRHIMKIILMEAFAVSLISGALGWLLGSVSATLLAPQFTGMSGLNFDPAMLGVSAALALLVGMSSSIYPAIKASRLDPIEALRYI